MRLLHLRDGELTFTRDLTHDIPRYAILSHTWGPDGEEVTFEDVIERRGQDKPGYKKIMFCGEQALRDDLEYFWVDTCCIDKRSHTELSRAINSMFRWYQQAVHCYVFLSDVSVESGPTGSWETQLRASKWFTRGWTLQELLAPISVKFYSAGGEFLGDKAGMVDMIHDITKIPVSAIQGTPLSEFAVGEKFEWSRRRETKEEEDIAYCLFGIFEVFIPLIYGEGKQNAMSRLQEAIDRRLGSPQTSPTPQTSRLMLPFGQNENFVGRENILAEVVAKIIPSARENDCQRLLLGGTPGIGKTQIAVEAAYRLHAQDPKCWIFWVPAATMKRFEDAYKKIGEALGTPGLNDGKADIKTLVKTSLEDCDAEWLLIIDGIDDIRLFDIFGDKGSSTSGLQDYLPFSRKGSILMTSLSREVIMPLGLSRTQICEIRGMSEAESLRLLSTSLEGWQYEGSPGTENLLLHLNYQPFAIHQSSTFIATMAETTASYLEYCLECHPESNEKNPWTLDSTQNLANLLQRKGKHHGAVFIYRQLLERKRSRFSPNDPSVLTSMDDLACALEVQGMHKEAEIMHRQVLELEKKINGTENERTLKSMNNLAISLQDQGKLLEAELMHRQELSLCRKLLGRDHPDTLKSRHNLALVLFKQNKYQDAEKVATKVMSLKAAKLGALHLSTLNSADLLAAVLCQLKKYEQSERVQRISAQGYTSVVGRSDPLRVASINNLVAVLRLQGKNKEAQEVQIRSLLAGDNLIAEPATARAQHTTRSKPKATKTKPASTKPSRTRPLRGPKVPWWKSF